MPNIWTIVKIVAEDQVIRLCLLSSGKSEIGVRTCWLNDLIMITIFKDFGMACKSCTEELNWVNRQEQTFQVVHLVKFARCPWDCFRSKLIPIKFNNFFRLCSFLKKGNPKSPISRKVINTFSSSQLFFNDFSFLFKLLFSLFRVVHYFSQPPSRSHTICCFAF